MKELKNIFKLARLDFKEDTEILEDLKNIIKWVDKLNEIDLNSENIKMSENIMDLRKDIKKSFDEIKMIYDNIPKKEDNYFLVPKVIKNG